MPQAGQFKQYDFERDVLAELYNEYRWTLRGHKVTLRSVGIQLWDSETHWGKWDPLTRTISISRKLVRNYSWFYVQAILRHEMAHQMADDYYGCFQQNHPPHCEHFLFSCQALGVAVRFRKASIDLQETSLDWKGDKEDEGSDKLLDKVQKLLALATSSNEHEALLAMNKVRELYAKYNLDRTQSEKKESFHHILICHKKKRIERYQDRIISILVEHFFVRVLTCHMFDAMSGEYHRAIEIIGTRENALMAEYVYHFLLQQSEFWVEEAIKSSKRKISSVERRSFRMGVLEGFSEKLRESEKPTTDTGSSTPFQKTSGEFRSSELSVIGKAVALFKRDKALDSYLEEVYPKLGTRSSGGYSVDLDSFSAGKAVGKSITLNKAVNTTSSQSGRLLG